MSLINFILNNKEISTELPPGMLLLDFVRYHKRLTGTKIGCREGDCGACTNLIGELKNGEVVYRSFTSCLTPLGNVQGKHVVTVEGINMAELNPIQQAMSDCAATQCGYCTPGFVVSLAGFCLSRNEPSSTNAVAAIDGNICRCTGYKSIEKASLQVAALMKQRSGSDPISFAVDNLILPAYFSTIQVRLQRLVLQMNEEQMPVKLSASFMGGGTDLYVQKHDEMKHTPIHFMYDKAHLNYIRQLGNKCLIGPSVSVTDLQESPIFQQYFPAFNEQVKLISSTPIRNMATIAGNFINASPIGDFTIFFLALDASLTLSNGQTTRQIPLRKFYKGYKQLDKQSDEFIEQISFELPANNSLFNFEKVCKRTHLDIASVNSAIHIETYGGIIITAAISAGGVGPIPLYLQEASTFLIGKAVSETVIKEAVKIAQSEVSPMSDARGTAAYKSLLLGQLIKAHFIILFKQKLAVEKLLF